MKILEKLTSLKNVNLIQFIPLIFVVSLVVNSVIGYTEPKAIKTPVTKTQEVEAKSSETTASEKDKTAQNTSDVDLDKINDGTYEGTGTGFGGAIVVDVTIKEGSIKDIQITKADGEDTAYLDNARKIMNNMVSSQSADVDVASGATYSSKGIIEAVKNALKEAS